MGDYEMNFTKTLIVTATAITFVSPAFAASCDKVTFSDVGWTDITATTAATTVVLEALGTLQKPNFCQCL
jgi:glycine betaine/proline transport system substrate-binding protein